MFTQSQILRFKNNTAVITDEGNQFSYDNLASFGMQLFEKIEQRCLVFSLCKNSIGSLIGYTSFIGNKVVPVLLDANLDKDLMRNLLDLYRPKFIWMPTEKLAEWRELETVYQLFDFTLVETNFNNEIPLNPDLALLFATSGSTGSPKLVRISYENIHANAQSIAQYLSLSSIDRPITVLPMNYSFGLSIINSHLLVGATLLLTNRSIMEKEFWQLLKNENATSLSGVPYTFEILHKLRFFRMDLPNLRTITQAGGKLNLNLNKEFAEYCNQTGKRFFVMYGQTEATARMSYLPCELAISKVGSVGMAIPNGEFMLVDEDHNEISNVDEVGELVYKGKNVSLGYAQSAEDLVKGNDNNGILFTGDLAKRDADGCYYIVGRKKRFIKLFGNRVNLDETEQLVKMLVHDCACVGEDDKMVIYISDEMRIKEVQEFISHKTGIHFKAFTVKYIDQIPKNHSGKTIYTNLEVN